MLRDGQNQASTGFRGAENLLKGDFIFADVFQHVERTDDVKFAIERYPPRIHSEQRNIRQALRRDFQSGIKIVAARQS